MGKIAIVTDSNSGITQAEAKELGIYVIPMPFYINEELFYEELTLSQEEFYKYLGENAEISTSMPSIADVTELWENLLKEYDEIVHIPMSSGLSSSCQTAIALAQDYDGKIQVVDNKRISVTQRQSAIDAKTMADAGTSAREIRRYLEDTAADSSIYITLDTLYYLKKGGRITPAAAALGTLLRLKPVLQIQGEKLDAYAKSRTLKAAKSTMLDAIHKDMTERFQATENADNMHIAMAFSGTDRTEIESWKEEVQKLYPQHDIVVNPLSLSISCHIGPGAIAITCTKKLAD
ncbi:MAG: DegV family protein [Lachnospiraceae bacterium]|nr:DegV family protein [Lachnospiraceae bacterium]MDD3615590.1 DegV family protein [Lachnospiraceae bacterium]